MKFIPGLFYGAYNLSTICQLNLMRMGSNGVLYAFNDRLKCKEELQSYFYKYRKDCSSSKNYKKYLSAYLSYIEAAAKSFQVPAQLLACLSFKESLWNKDAKSTAGAIGLMQFMPDTINVTNNILKMADFPMRTVNKKKAKLEEIRKKIAKRKRLTTEDKRSKNFLEKWIKNWNRTRPWLHYVDTIRNLPAFKKKYPRRPPWGGRYPTRFSPERAWIPSLAIGASALYLKDIMRLFSKSSRLKGGIKNGSRQSLEFLTFVAGAYNAGEGNAVDAVGRRPGNNIGLWIKKFSNANPKHRVQRTNHMESIRRCMEKGNWKGPTAGNRFATQPPLCEKGKKKRKRKKK